MMLKLDMRKGFFIVIVLVLGLAAVAWVADRRPVAGPTVSTEEAAGPSQVAIVVASGGATRAYGVDVVGETSAAALLLSAADQHGFPVESRDFGGDLGLFIEAIDGIESNAETGRYWFLYVNGQAAPAGASATIIHPGDTVTWQYEQMKEEL
jgi:hypothetical protein